MSDFENRLLKNARHRHKWAKARQLTAYRLYDLEIPQYPVAVDWYAGRVQVQLFPRTRAVKTGSADQLKAEVHQAVSKVLEVPSEAVFLKEHRAHVWGKEQYEKLEARADFFTVEEQGLQFWVNLTDYLDSGLFLDHRFTRARIRKEANGKRFLNLFGYTGSFAVYASAGGAAECTTVDLSNTYCDWAERNLELNQLKGPTRQVVRDDVFAFLTHTHERGRRYELIVLDPPSFSTSKKMERAFDVQKDQRRLLQATLSVLEPGGTLYFSTNYRQFALDETVLSSTRWEEITPASIPEDFHQRNIHRCWRIEML